MVSVLMVAFVALLGLVVGSFLGALVYRLPREGLSVVRGRSRCPHCCKTIAWFDNLPLLSYVLLGGRCRSCRAPISLRYPVIEALTAVFFVLFYVQDVGWRAIEEGRFGGLGLLLVHLGLVSAMIAATFVDLEWQILPDRITVPGMVLAPFLSAWVPEIHRGGVGTQWASDPGAAAMLSSLAGIAAGAGTILGAGWFGRLIFRKEAMGRGDVKFLAMIGGFIGPVYVLLAFVLACFVGSVAGLIRLWMSGDRYIPFGPFLSIGALIMLLAHEPVTSVVRAWLWR